MNSLPEKAKNIGSTIFNFAKAIGPCLISQSEKASKEFAKHKAKLAYVDAMKEIMVIEAKTLQSVKDELVKRYIDSDNIERIRIKRDLREIDESMRTLNIGQKSLAYLPEFNEENEEPEEEITKPIISDSWLDRFNELAKLSNESWREDLLARALAKESDSPGSVSPRALWLLGTLEENLFYAFATLLDASVFVASGPMIPNGKTNANDLKVPDCILGEGLKTGNLVYMLSDVGLIADTLSTTRTLQKGRVFFAQYGIEKFVVDCKGFDLKVNGIIYTKLGSSIASFYEANPNKLGHDVFHDWLDSLNKEQFEVTKVA